AGAAASPAPRTQRRAGQSPIERSKENAMREIPGHHPHALPETDELAAIYNDVLACRSRLVRLRELNSQQIAYTIGILGSALLSLQAAVHWAEEGGDA